MHRNIFLTICSLCAFCLTTFSQQQEIKYIKGSEKYIAPFSKLCIDKSGSTIFTLNNRCMMKFKLENDSMILTDSMMCFDSIEKSQSRFKSMLAISDSSFMLIVPNANKKQVWTMILVT